METRVSRYSNTTKKTSRRSLVAIASAAAMFTVGGGVMASYANLDDMNSDGYVAKIKALGDATDTLVQKLSGANTALDNEKDAHAKDIASGRNYQAEVQKAVDAANTKAGSDSAAYKKAVSDIDAQSKKQAQATLANGDGSNYDSSTNQYQKNVVTNK
ncbi:hypothetical protein G6R29_05195 [Fructobacillus sp. M2-14]|uniref:Uncharacterized protein n=1 Tax=Fructobacillus broussonetiae TaxID=2713173 RepID=A0ABS5R0Q8_9LACO|nr:hypothetical protein [Fructobacillus broussonetiae]MBS9339015.1 hypothetical protein [Fructobacillus broussonetiae]